MAKQIELSGGADIVEWSGWSDTDFLKRVGWKRGTATDIVQAAKSADVDAFVRAMAAAWGVDDQSVKRGRAADPTRADPCLALWSLPAFVPTTREAALAAAVAVPKARRKVAAVKKVRPVDPLEAWWQKLDPTSPLSTWEYLVLLEMLPRRVSKLSPATALAIWRKLLTIAADTTQLAQLADEQVAVLDPTEEIARYGFASDPYFDLSLLRSCELPWLAGVVFAHVKGADKLRLAGAELLEHELVERTDDLGMPHADLLPRLPLWLAISTRIVGRAQRDQIPLWDVDAAELYAAFIERIAPLIGMDGRFALSHIQMPEPRPFAEAVLRASNWSETDAALEALFVRPRRMGHRSAAVNGDTSAPRRKPPEICIAPGGQSDESGWAILRTHWGSQADRAAVMFDQPALNIDLSVQGRPLLVGEWFSELSIAGETHPLKGSWYCLCWQSDEDVDYIELQIEIRNFVQVDRQIVLSRTGQFCLVAESISNLSGEPFQYRSRLPLAEGVSGKTISGTRELQLDADGVPVRVFPLSLPDRHELGTPGRLAADFSFKMTGSGKAWYNPILLDWSPSRRTSSATCKALTVAEQQRVLRPESASGHRIKIGNKQWLIYRSLQKSSEPRSVLGHQTKYETVIGAVELTGEITPLMLVE